MEKNMIEGIQWYADSGAQQKGEPGICHSFLKSLATVLNHVDRNLDPVRLMGSSAWAFRISVNEVFCPSAMSIFDFNTLLPETINQCGFEAQHIARFWNDDAHEQSKREEAHAAIIASIDRGVPVVVWDIAEVEWGLVVGCDSQKKTYHTLTHRGERSELPFERLGRNGVNILSVSLVGAPNGRGQDQVIRKSLQIAVDHAQQREWTQRPAYQNGLEAFEMWATLYEKAALIADAVGTDRVPEEVWVSPKYYADHYFGARCYARDYLRALSEGNTTLTEAATCYEKVADHLRPVWENAPSIRESDPATLRAIAQHIRDAQHTEREGIEHIKAFLG